MARLRFITIYAVIYLIVFLAIGVMRSYGVDTSVAMGIGLFVVMLIMSRPIYILYFSRNLKRIDRYLERYFTNPILKYTYIVAHGTKEEEQAAIADILAKYQQPAIQHTYLFTQALLQDDLQTAEAELQRIPKEQHRSYAEAYVEALKGNAEKARSYSLSKPWMVYAIDAVIAYEAKQIPAFKAAVDQTLAATRGLQYYQFVAKFRKMTDGL